LEIKDAGSAERVFHNDINKCSLIVKYLFNLIFYDVAGAQSYNSAGAEKPEFAQHYHINFCSLPQNSAIF
jgi:hypothetical protein